MHFYEFFDYFEISELLEVITLADKNSHFNDFLVVQK
jgi:hypothetical protein